MPCRERRRCYGRDADQVLCKTLDDRAKLRDIKDLRFGMGLSSMCIGEPTRRDRLLLVNAFAIVLLTMLGAAGEALGTDRLC